MNKVHLVKTDQGYNLVSKNKTLSLSKEDALNSFEVFKSFTKESASSIKKITFRTK